MHGPTLALFALRLLADVGVAPETAPSPSPPSAVLRPGWYLPVGASLASVTRTRSGTGLAVGAEASAVCLLGNLQWAGAMADVVYDVDARRARMSAGPEIGLLFFTLDGGFVVDVGDGSTGVGAVVRPMLSLGFVHAYARWGWLAGDAPDPRFREVGVLLKWPFVLLAQPDLERPGRGAAPTDPS